MKAVRVLAIAWLAIGAIRADGRKSEDAELLKRASAQLDRLAGYRRSSSEFSASASGEGERPGSRAKPEKKTAITLGILPAELELGLPGKMREEEAVLELISDPRYVAILRERIKRSGYGYGPSSSGGGYEEGYGEGYDSNKNSGSGGALSGSASIIGGITSGIISGIVGASKGSSAGSSKPSYGSPPPAPPPSYYGKPEYKPSYNDEDKGFGAWDIKKGILNTVVQAIKAISGGVVALKGQLIKGSGFLVSTKGKIISSTGEAISSLGRQIATNAIAASPKNPPHPTYAYEGPHPTGEDDTYDGPPPPTGAEYSAGDFGGHVGYGSPSDEHADDYAGLLIVKPTKSEPGDEEEVHPEYPPGRKPPVPRPEQSYLVPPKESSEKDAESHASGNKYPGGAAILHPTTHSGDYPPPVGSLGPLSIQQSYEYRPFGSLELANGENSGNDVYSSFTIGMYPYLDGIEIGPLRTGAKFELPTVHGYPSPYPDFYSQQPLKIPILGAAPPPVRPWPSQGFAHPSLAVYVVYSFAFYPHAGYGKYKRY